MKKTTVSLLALVVLIAGFAIWSATRVTPLPVTLVNVERGDVRATVSNTRAGTVSSCSRARLAPISGGRISSLLVSEGDRVEAGQVLVEMWNADVHAQLILVQKERLAASARADEACTGADVAQRESARFQTLHERQLISEEQADSALGNAQARASACEAMRSMVEVNDARIALAEATLEQTILRAPFSGTVAEINGEVGEVITPSPVGVVTLPAVDLIDSSCMFVKAPIDEVDAPGIRSGMSASITLDAYPGTRFPATVRRVAPYVLDQEKQARTVDIEAEFDTPSENLLPGYSADVEVILDVHPEALHIPTQALIDGDHVLILNDEGVLEKRAVQVGLGNWQITEIVEGLAEGDKVVLSVDRTGVIAGASAFSE